MARTITSNKIYFQYYCPACKLNFHKKQDSIRSNLITVRIRQCTKALEEYPSSACNICNVNDHLDKYELDALEEMKAINILFKLKKQKIQTQKN